MRVLSVLLALAVLPAAAAAQLIQIRTVPVAAGDQFLLVPSRTLAMGGVTIAVEDPLADPWVNPATGARVPGGGQLYAAPAFYSITEGAGNARTLPMGAFFGAGASRWFGGTMLAFQQVSDGDRFGGCCIRTASGVPLSDGTGYNLYAHGVLGRRLETDGDLAVGISVLAADLSAVDGVDLLYPRAQAIDQFGHLVDLRAGLAGAVSPHGTLELVALHNRFDMTYEVTQLTSFTGVATTQTNLDRTHTWGVHGNYIHAVGAATKLGAALTVNRKSHPKLPNYDLMNIPRDPGTSWAWALGLGIAREEGPTTIAADVVIQPIRTHTWAEAAAPVTATDGSVIPTGGKTVDNRFRFTNAVIRLGLERRMRPVSFALGLEAYAIGYTLRQQDLVAQSTRTQDERWVEWTPTLGLSAEFPEFTLRYTGRLTTGTGHPGVSSGAIPVQEGARTAADFIPAPSGPLTLQDALVLTHQVAVVMPLR